MKRILSVMLGSILLVGASTVHADSAQKNTPSKGYTENTPTKNRAEARMDVKVTYVLDGYGTKDKPFSDASFKPIPNARLIIIDCNGKIVGNGITDSKGEWSMKINTPIDRRFPTKNMGIVTVIAVADGFNEFINFNVLVNENGDGAGKVGMVLRPIIPDSRNEPLFNAQFHRFTVFDMLDYYAKKVGLVKQKQIQGAVGFGEVDMPWSATIN
ncbi:hypothetical protein I8J29_22585 [Paenibacillus sp. MWE-103]|uniref:Uncharacterized protein n=1 Tax=Paenibacillus artemisiicola TaxID=1172618 RepID=A0ABS3WFV3_9BACL|nr:MULTISPECIES: hypothetical protein [Paenibacillus]MBO7746995.1 hypothetical protein [Paenibacillus artemisiicola]SFJ55162.1 hypothetical protein SAMN02799624_04975 [Paenibacillus sp. UNC496MF]